MVIFLKNGSTKITDFPPFKINCSTAYSVLSLISYFSYIFDFQDFSRNRPGSGGWSQPIKRACSILRNYGTFREPSFLAVWLAPVIPLNFYLARKRAIWYGLSILPILAIILSRSLTGVISLILGILFAAVLWTLKNKNFDSNIAHEATTSKISEEQLHYCQTKRT